ncbi:MAG: universal stress protein [Hyphomicrobiaceae bacterium]|nr:universal stress protein [Hyphomicrobiaceae bacterium]
MAVKTILVHLNDRRRAASLLAPAIGLAERFEAHLIGFNVFTGVPATAALAVPYGADVIDSVLAAERSEAVAIRTIFEKATAGRSLVAEWISEKAPHSDLAAFVMQRGRSADLIVASQTDPAWDLAAVYDFPERLALESGRPVLVVPVPAEKSIEAPSRGAGIARRVLVAWNGKREAARAAFDALPILLMAEHVHILTVAEHPWDQKANLSGHAIAAALARHGIAVSLDERKRGGATIGEVILDATSDHRAELVVMGAYGHSRFRELVFGGATREVLRNMRIATLLSH